MKVGDLVTHKWRTWGTYNPYGVVVGELASNNSWDECERMVKVWWVESGKTVTFYEKHLDLEEQK